MFLWNDTSISENPECDRIFKNAGRESYFEVEKDGHKNSNHIGLNYIKLNHADSIPTNSTNIKPTNQHDYSNWCSLQKLMSCNSHDPQSSTYSTRTVPCNFTRRSQLFSYPPPLLPPNYPSLPERVTPTENFMPLNKHPKQVPHVPNDPNPDISLSYSSTSY